MLAAVIRRERYGQPHDALRIEQVSVPPVGDRRERAIVNYNGVWAAGGAPVDLIFRAATAWPPGELQHCRLGRVRDRSRRRGRCQKPCVWVTRL
jgi:hypothetical protein